MTEGIEKVTTPGGKAIAYHFTEAMFPARDLIEPAINAAGYDMDESYSGTSRESYLIELFIESIKLGRLSVMDRTTVPVSRTSVNQTLDVIILRFELSPKEEILVRSVNKMITSMSGNKESIRFTNVQDIHYVVLASIILTNGKKTTGAASFFTIMKAWKEIYKSDSLAPVMILRNVAETLGIVCADRNFMTSEFMKESDYEDVIYLSCKFSAEQLAEFQNSKISAQKIITYMNSGFTGFKEIYDFAIDMPEEWFAALL